MQVSKPSAAFLCGLATLLLCVSTAEAQTRRAVPRPAGRRVAARPPARVVYFRGYGYRPYSYRPYYYGHYDPFFYGPYPSPYFGARYDQSSVRLEVKPTETEVYVDGYYAGVADSYDGFFQRLRLSSGEHEIELHLDGYESTRETLYLVAGETYKIRHEMEALTAGAPQPPRPEPSAPPAPAASPGRRRGPPVGQSFAAEQFGTLAVRVQPLDAEVLIDGEVWRGFEGLNRVVVDLGAGLHEIEVRRDGYRTYRAEIEVREADTTVLNVSLPSSDEEIR